MEAWVVESLSFLITVSGRVGTRDLPGFKLADDGHAWETTDTPDPEHSREGQNVSIIFSAEHAHTRTLARPQILNLLSSSSALHPESAFQSSHTCLSKPWFEITWSLVQMDAHGRPVSLDRDRERVGVQVGGWREGSHTRVSLWCGSFPFLRLMQHLWFHRHTSNVCESSICCLHAFPQPLQFLITWSL